jgi:Uma2 family endonuclease
MLDPIHIDQRVLVRASWETYRQLERARGESAATRLTFDDGLLELITPSIDHCGISRMIHALLMTWAEETNTDLNGFGSWTIKDEDREIGLEPDECYLLGKPGPPVPDIAVEVLWTHGGIDKLELYRRLGVKEVWLWDRGTLVVHALAGGRYHRRRRSRLLPALDLAQLVKFVDYTEQVRALRAYRAALHKRRP